MINMQYTVFFLLALGIFASLWIESDAGVAIDRHTRGACWAGEAGCTAYCWRQGRKNGGCCGQSHTHCHGTCYCNGSGYEHRCYSCDL